MLSANLSTLLGAEVLAPKVLDVAVLGVAAKPYLLSKYRLHGADGVSRVQTALDEPDDEQTVLFFGVILSRITSQ